MRLGWTVALLALSACGRTSVDGGLVEERDPGGTGATGAGTTGTGGSPTGGGGSGESVDPLVCPAPGACSTNGLCTGTILSLAHLGSDDTCELNGIAAATDDAFVIGGRFYGDLDFGPSTTPITDSFPGAGFVASIEADGTPRWVRVIRAERGAFLSAIALDPSGDVVATGRADSSTDFGGGPVPGVGGFDVIVAKYRSDGTLAWAGMVGTDLDEEAYDVAVGPDGSIVAVGRTFTAGLGSSQGRHAAVFGLNGEGSLSWTAQITSSNSSGATSVASAPDGTFVVAGNFVDDVDFGNGPASTHPDHGFFLAKYSAQGALLFGRTYGGSGMERAWDLALDASGDIVLVGEFSAEIDLGSGPVTSHGFADILVAKFDPRGNARWVQPFGGADPERAASVAVDAFADILVAVDRWEPETSFPVPIDGVTEPTDLVFKLDPCGAPLWARGASSLVQPVLATTTSGEVLLGGQFSVLLELGDGYSQPVSGETQSFAARLAR